MFKFFYRVFFSLTVFCLKNMKKPKGLDMDALRLQIALQHYQDTHSPVNSCMSFNEYLQEHFQK